MGWPRTYCKTALGKSQEPLMLIVHQGMGQHGHGLPRIVGVRKLPSFVHVH